MTWDGLRAAAEHAKTLSSFGSVQEARHALLGVRDEALRALETAARGSSFSAEYSPESLKSLETWYFQLLEADFSGAPTRRDELEKAIAMYFGQVLVRNAGFEWVVEEYAFAPGKFEVGVRRSLFTWMLSTFDLATRPNNKRRQSLWRDYKRYSE